MFHVGHIISYGMVSTFNKKNCGAVCPHMTQFVSYKLKLNSRPCIFDFNYSFMQVHASKCMRLELSSVVINIYQLLITFCGNPSLLNKLL